MRKLTALALALSAVLATAASARERSADTLVISASDCRRLMTVHEPAADVAYREGIDVRGKPVVPADLPGTVRIRTPEQIVVDIVIPLDVFLGHHAPPLTEDAGVYAGTVVLEGGRLFYDGQPLDDPVTAAIAAQCRRVLRPRP